MRSIWSGSLSFGLINIPVKIYSASEERALKFRMLEKHGHCPISYAKICRDTGKEVPFKDIVKGYEYEKGDFVILTDEDFEKASPRKTKTIDIIQFVDEAEVPVAFIHKPYFIEPDKKAEKAYVLLCAALKKAKKSGLARWVLKDKEHIALVRPENNALMLIQLRFQDELRKPDELHIPDKAEYTKKELDIALSLIEQLSEHFDAKEYHDTYTEELKKIIARKAKGKPIRLPDEQAPVPTDMRYLMELLKGSLEKAKTKHGSR